jgi:hypothetical protein
MSKCFGVLSRDELLIIYVVTKASRGTFIELHHFGRAAGGASPRVKRDCEVTHHINTGFDGTFIGR